jgi:DNA-binding IclR family transcriptional regulator
MKTVTKSTNQAKPVVVPRPASGPTYSAPALDKGLDILETLCRSNVSLSQTQIAEKLGRSVGEIYRMLTCLVSRNYLVNAGDTYAITTKIFELAHSNPPTNRLLAEAGPIMQELSSALKQACHLTVYNQGRQIVVAKVDNPSGLGFSVRVGADLDVLVSASGRVLLAFQDQETTELRIKESVRERPDHADRKISQILDAVRTRGFESIVSAQIKGLHAVSYPILDTRNCALAALTVPYAERLDQSGRKTISEVEAALGQAARALSERIGWRDRAAPDLISGATLTSTTLSRGHRAAAR